MKNDSIKLLMEFSLLNSHMLKAYVKRLADPIVHPAFYPWFIKSAYHILISLDAFVASDALGKYASFDDVKLLFLHLRPSDAIKRYSSVIKSQSDFQEITAFGDVSQFVENKLHRSRFISYLKKLVNWLTYQSYLLYSPEFMQMAQRREAEDLAERLTETSAENVQTFYELLQRADRFSGQDVPRISDFYASRNIAPLSQYKNLTLIQALDFVTVFILTQRGQPLKTETKLYIAGDDLYYPDWCCTAPTHADDYLKKGPLYFVDKACMPYVLISFPGGEAHDARDEPIDRFTAVEIAPLFLSERKFPESLIKSVPLLAEEIIRFREQSKLGESARKNASRSRAAKL